MNIDELQKEINTLTLKIDEIKNNHKTVLSDLNNDLTLNVMDVILMVDCIISSSCNDCSDLNEDGSTDILDIIDLINIILE